MSDNRVTADHVVSIHYTLFDDAGNEIDASFAETPLHYLHGHDQIVPGLESALDGKSQGESVTVTVPPEEGFGVRDANRVIQVPRTQFDFEPEVGQAVEAQMPSGQAVHLIVTGVAEDAVTLDGNHPLADRTLKFEVTVADVRPATDEEIARGEVEPLDVH